jgi:hypothetical protein
VSTGITRSGCFKLFTREASVREKKSKDETVTDDSAKGKGTENGQIGHRLVTDWTQNGDRMVTEW